MIRIGQVRFALLAGVATGAMAVAGPVAAGDLSELKAEMEALQQRVGDLESQPQAAALPPGTSLLTMSRGHIGADLNRPARAGAIPEGRGFTISVTPAADIPAPVAEVVVYGFVKGDVIYDFDHHEMGDSFYIPSIWSQNGRNDAGTRLHARQSKFGIRSKVDTAVGQIRTLIEGDFFADSGSFFRLRYAWGEWDFAPYWTFAAGQQEQTAGLVELGIETVDISGDAGPQGYDKVPQVRLTYKNDPITWAVAVEKPSHTSDAKWPNFSTYLQYEFGDNLLSASATVADWDTTDSTGKVGWAVQAGGNFALGDFASFTVGAGYGEREMCKYLNQSLLWCDPTDADKDGSIDFSVDQAWGVLAGVNIPVTDTTAINLGGGWSHLENGIGGGRSETIKAVDVYSVHGNVLWQPVDQLRLGWEVMWGQYVWDARGGAGAFDGPARRKDDAVRAQFGAWFYF